MCVVFWCCLITVTQSLTKSTGGGKERGRKEEGKKKEGREQRKEDGRIGREEEKRKEGGKEGKKKDGGRGKKGKKAGRKEGSWLILSKSQRQLANIAPMIRKQRGMNTFFFSSLSPSCSVQDCSPWN